MAQAEKKILLNNWRTQSKVFKRKGIAEALVIYNSSRYEQKPLI